jgi:hypothetical protein
MMRGMQMVAMRYVCMMCRLLVIARLMMFGGFAVMVCCFIVMLRSLMMVLAGLL